MFLLAPAINQVERLAHKTNGVSIENHMIVGRETHCLIIFSIRHNLLWDIHPHALEIPTNNLYDSFLIYTRLSWAFRKIFNTPLHLARARAFGNCGA